MPHETLQSALKDPFANKVYFFASQDVHLLRRNADKVRAALLKEETDITRLDGPAIDMSEVIASAGVISFFGTPRAVELKEIVISSMKDKDIDELIELFSELENAVLLITVLHKDKRTAQSKKAKAVFSAAKEVGFALEISPLNYNQQLLFIKKNAEEYGVVFGHGAAEALLDRTGSDLSLLENEVAKLSAFCGYKTVDKETVEKYAVHNVQADAFSLAAQITSGRKVAAYDKLNALLMLKYEPVMIAGALAGTFIDMYRVRVAKNAGQTWQNMMRDFGYKSEYRLKKSAEAAQRYTTESLRECIKVLSELDRKLKSSALADKSVLLQTAVAQLMQMGK